MKTTRENTKEHKEKDENPAPNDWKKTKELKEKVENPAPDVSAYASTLATAKKARKKATKKVEKAKLTVAMARAKLFQLYGNLLSDEARQPYEEVMKAQVIQVHWEDIFGVPCTKTPTKSWYSFCDCIKFHI